MSTRYRLALASLFVPLVLAFAACGATTDSADNASKNAPSSGGHGPAPAASDAVGERDFTADAAKPAADTTIQRAVIATGSLRLTAPHLADARQDAFALVTGLGGHVANEQSLSDSHGRLSSVDLTLRVPADSFGKALDGLSELGTVRHREQSTKDVTTEVIDVAARVRAQRASVENIERLLARATTIGEIMSVERQLSTRQAELDSLEQQQKWLADQTSLSTIEVTLTRPASRAHPHAAGGFVSGLDGGWHALGATAVAVGTAVGAVLPFAVVVALIGTPVWLVLRRRTAATAPPATEV